MDKVKVMRHGRVVEVPNCAPMILEVGVMGIPGRPGEKGEKGDKGDKGDGGGVETTIDPIELAVIDNLF